MLQQQTAKHHLSENEEIQEEDHPEIVPHLLTPQQPTTPQNQELRRSTRVRRGQHSVIHLHKANQKGGRKCCVCKLSLLNFTTQL